MGSERPIALLAASALGLALITGGCGTGSSAPSATRQASAAHAGTSRPDRAGSVAGNADRESVRVISAWAGELRRGRVQAASRLFALPSRVQVSVGSQIFTLRRRAQIVAFNEVLPCGAKLLRADRRGRFVNALFLLADRADSPCDAPGASARVAFVVRGGLIREWYRAPSEASDPGNPPPAAPASPGAPAPSAPGTAPPPDQQTPTTPDTPVPGAPAAGGTV